VAFDYVLSLYRSMGYRDPPDDGGVDGPEFDIYIRDLTPKRLYGEATYPPRVSVNIDNDFQGSDYYTKGLDGMRVTAAHEFHHAVQFAYRVNSDDFFYYEATSVFMEDVAYDGINDYLHYLPKFLGNPQQPFTRYNGNHEYGLALWHFYLTKKHDLSIIREIWEEFGTAPPILMAVEKTLNRRGTTFDEALGEFYVWNYFTGSRADTVQFYPEGDIYPEVFVNSISLLNDTTVSSTYLAPRYFELTDAMPLNYELIATDDENIDRWVNNLVVVNLPKQVELSKFTEQSEKSAGLIINIRSIASRIIWIPTSVAREEGSYTLNFSVESFSPIPYISSVLLPNYPNPFIVPENDICYLPFYLDNPNEVEMRIFSGNGSVIKTVYYGSMTKGFHYTDVWWDGKNSDGEYVPSGIYLYHMKAGEISLTHKLAVIRK